MTVHCFKEIPLQSSNRLLLLALIGIAVFLSGCATTGSHSLGLMKLKGKVPAEKLLVVDCLLPPSIRKVGSQMTYLAARRPIKTTALDCEIRGGEYVAYDRADYRTALNVWLEQANNGDPEAQTYVGEIYEKGMGLAPDYRLAFTWYERAAQQNYPRAQINLGYLYEKGLGVPRNKLKALKWYRRASGITEDLIYGVEAAQKDTEINVLRSSLAEAQRQLRQLETQLNISKRKLRNLQREIERQRSIGADIQSLARDYLEQQRQIESDRQVLSQLQSMVQQQQTMLSRPRIEVTNPTALKIRGGEQIIKVRSGERVQIISGKVIAPAGLQQASINGRPLATDRQGLFNTAVSISGNETKVIIGATDKRGRTTRVSFILTPNPGKSDQSGIDKISERVVKSVDYGRYYALVIGNDEYQHYPRLDTAANDARRVGSVLESRYGFKTTVLINADRYTMLSAINEIKARLRENDNVLIYYAGHGVIDPATQQGYWLPVDAERGNTANWVSNAEISDLLSTFSARHILVVADSCYSGSMSQTSIPRLNVRLDQERLKKWLSTMAKTRSRTVLTSGGLQPVLDSGGGKHSVFAQAFISELETRKGVLDAYRLFVDVSKEVELKASALGFEQTPTYAPIRHAGHGGGEFILISV